MLSLVTMERSQSYKGRPRASDGRSLATSSEMGVKKEKTFCNLFEWVNVVVNVEIEDNQC
ncbi:hypothetical protein JHK82_057297 [Glycine max]|uniref:Uncharacterized protein n=1 Tax=Glycine max TaxID=3847 RepID=A0A0R0ERU1_SOYBN|nr:hypothetical protein JHK87_057401 [Glycine soja]KAG4919871.1 hypothetical protein JHK85_058152 [Glycine max]KAG5078602.1 hypothetical protein JHK82_057297 [Glycine max]KAH1037705.1 hypothetical protein GYH30_056836 [Glycine max]